MFIDLFCGIVFSQPVIGYHKTTNVHHKCLTSWGFILFVHTVDVLLPDTTLHAVENYKTDNTTVVEGNLQVA